MKRLIYLLPLLLIGCRPLINLTSQEYVRVEVRDTVIFTKLVPYSVAIKTKDTISKLETPYARSIAMWSNGFLSHNITTKDTIIGNMVSVPTTTRTVVKQVNALSKEQKAKIEAYDGLNDDIKRLNKDVVKLKASNKDKTALIWKLIVALGLCGVWILRKPIGALIKLL